MGKWVADVVLDAALDKIATATIQTVCSAQPATRTDAVTTLSLAEVPLSGVDFTKADGSINGRKVTVASKAGVPVVSNGNATHVALCDGSVLLYVTTCTAQTLAAGNTLTFGTWSVEIGDPT